MTQYVRPMDLHSHNGGCELYGCIPVVPADEHNTALGKLGERSTQLEQALRDVRQMQRALETSNGYVTIGRRLHDVEKILSRIMEPK